MFWGFFQHNLCELPEKPISPRLTLQREIGKREEKRLFYHCECEYEGRARRREQEMEKSDISKFLRSQKTHCHTQTSQDVFHFPAPFSPGVPILSCDSDWRLCLYLPPLCSASLYWTPYLISVSTGGSFAPSHSSISGPAGSAESPHQERAHHNCHCFHSVTPALTSKNLPPPQSPPIPLIKNTS